jgi:MFS family permease
VLAAVQAGRAIIFGALGVLVVTDQIQIWHVLPVAVVSGMLMATMLPAGEALVYDAVGPKRLLNAVAFKSGASKLSGIVSSLAAGFVITAFGTGWYYVLVGALMVVSPLPLLWIKTGYTALRNRKSVWQTLSEGVAYASKSPPVRLLLVFSMAMEMFGYSYFAMLPVIAKEVLHLEADGLGYLSAASNVGGVLSILLLAAISDFRNRTLIVVVCGLCTGAFLILFAMSSWFAVSLVLVGLIGAALSAYDPTMSASLQTLTADAMRGRIMGLYGLTFGFTPVGGLWPVAWPAWLAHPLR